MKSPTDFWEVAMAKLGFKQEIQDLTDAQVDQVEELARILYKEWGEDMLAAEEYEQARKGPEVQV